MLQFPHPQVGPRSLIIGKVWVVSGCTVFGLQGAGADPVRLGW